jgi:hypothetical protein
VESPLGYVAWFLKLFFDVWSVICRLHNLWPPFKIPFCLVPPIVFSFRVHAFQHDHRGPFAAFHGMARKCHIEGSMITAVWTHLRMFLNSKFDHFMFKCWILLKPVLRGVDDSYENRYATRTCTKATMTSQSFSVKLFEVYIPVYF